MLTKQRPRGQTKTKGHSGHIQRLDRVRAIGGNTERGRTGTVKELGSDYGIRWVKVEWDHGTEQIVAPVDLVRVARIN